MLMLPSFFDLAHLVPLLEWQGMSVVLVHLTEADCLVDAVPHCSLLTSIARLSLVRVMFGQQWLLLEHLQKLHQAVVQLDIIQIACWCSEAAGRAPAHPPKIKGNERDAHWGVPAALHALALNQMSHIS